MRHIHHSAASCGRWRDRVHRPLRAAVGGTKGTRCPAASTGSRGGVAEDGDGGEALDVWIGGGAHHLGESVEGGVALRCTAEGIDESREMTEGDEGGADGLGIGEVAEISG